MEETNNVQSFDSKQLWKDVSAIFFMLSILFNLYFVGGYFYSLEVEKNATYFENISDETLLSNGKLYGVRQRVTKITPDYSSEPIYKLVTEINYKQKKSLINFGDDNLYSLFFIKDLNEVEKLKCIEYEKALLEAQRLYLLNNQKCK